MHIIFPISIHSGISKYFKLQLFLGQKGDCAFRVFTSRVFENQTLIQFCNFTIMELTTTANGFVLFSLITLFGIHKGMYCFRIPRIDFFSGSFLNRFIPTDLFLFAQRKRFNYFCFKNQTVQIKMYSLAKLNIQ